MSQEHIIDKYTVEVQAKPSVSKEFIHRQIASEKAALFAAIEEVFDQYFPEEEWIHISKIHLDLGTLPSKDFIPVLRSRLQSLLASEFKKLQSTEAFQAYTAAQKTKTLYNDRFYVLETYLRKGYSIGIQSLDHFDLDVFILQLLETDAIKLFTLLQEMAEDVSVQTRFKRIKSETLAQLKAHPASKMFKSLYDEVLSKQDQKTFELLKDYMRGKTLLKGISLDISSSISALYESLSEAERIGLAQFVLQYLHQEDFIRQLSIRVLNVYTLQRLFSSMDTLRPVLESWKTVEALLKGLGYETRTSSTDYKYLFLKYLSLPIAEKEKRYELVYHYMQHHSHLIGVQTQEAFSWERLEILKQDVISAEFKTYLAQQKRFPQKPKDSSSLGIFLYFLQYGILKDSPKSLADLIVELLLGNPRLLVTKLHELWQEEGVRYRLVQRLDQEQLRQLSSLLWAHHESYASWLEVQTGLDKYLNKSSFTAGERLLKELYLLYFEFAAIESSELGAQASFEEWMQIGIQQLFTERSKQYEAVDQELLLVELFPQSFSATAWNTLLVRLVQHAANQEALALILSRIRLQKNRDEAQLFFETLWQETEALGKVLRLADIPESFWTEFLHKLSASQRERVFQIVHPIYFEGWLKLKTELQALGMREGLVLICEEPLLPFQTWFGRLKKETSNDKPLNFIRFLVEQLYGSTTNFAQSIETLLNVSGAVHLYPTLYAVVNDLKETPLSPQKLEPLVPIAGREVEKEISSLNLDTYSFLEILTHRFPNVSGFLQIYLKALEPLKEDLAIVWDKTQYADFYTFLYAYLKTQEQEFSASALIRVSESYLSTQFGLSVSLLRESFRKVIAQKLSQGEARFSVLESLIPSAQSDDEEADRFPSFELDPAQKTRILAEVSNLQVELLQKAVEEDLERSVERKQFEQFKQVYIQYLQRSTTFVPIAMASHVYVEPLLYLRAFFTEQSGRLQAVLKSILASSTYRDLLLQSEHGDLRLWTLRELAGQEYEVCEEWMVHTQAFLLQIPAMPEAKVLESIFHKVLMDLLLLASTQTLGYSLFLEKVVDTLQELGFGLSKNRTMADIESYKTLVSNVPDFQKAWERVLQQEAQKQRATELTSLIGAKSVKQEQGTSLPQDFELISFVTQSTPAQIQSYFKQYLPQKELLRNQFKNISPSPLFWIRLTKALGNTDLEQVLKLLYPQAYAHLIQLQTELQGFINTQGLSDIHFFNNVQQRYLIWLETVHRISLDSDSLENLGLRYLRLLILKEPQFLKSFLQPKGAGLSEYPLLAETFVKYLNTATSSIVQFKKDKKQSVDSEVDIVNKVRDSSFRILERSIEKELQITQSPQMWAIFELLKQGAAKMELEKLVEKTLEGEKEFITHFWSDVLPGTFWFTLLRGLQVSLLQRVWQELLPERQYHDMIALVDELEPQFTFTKAELHRDLLLLLRTLSKEVLAKDFVSTFIAHLAHERSGILGAMLAKVKEGTLVLDPKSFLRLHKALHLDAKPELSASMSVKGKKLMDAKTFMAKLGAPDMLQSHEELLFIDMKQLLERQFPLLSSFVIDYLLVLKEMFKKNKSLSLVLLPDIYWFVYEYLVVNNKDFSSQLFIEETLAYLSGISSKPKTQLRKWLLQSTEAKVQRGGASFRALQVLLSGAIDSDLGEAYGQAVESSEGNLGVESLSFRNSLGGDTLDPLDNVQFLQIIAPIGLGSIEWLSAYLEVLTEALNRFEPLVEALSEFVYVEMYRRLKRPDIVFSGEIFVAEMTAWLTSHYQISKEDLLLNIQQILEQKTKSGLYKYTLIQDFIGSYLKQTIKSYPAVKEVIIEEEVALSRAELRAHQQNLILELKYQDLLDYLLYASNQESSTASHSPVLSKAIFLQIIALTHTQVSGFVSTYLHALEEALDLLNLSASELREALYLEIYAYLSPQEEAFSAADFVKALNATVVEHYPIAFHELATALWQVTDVNIKKGLTRYAVLQELLSLHIKDATALVPELTGTQTPKDLYSLREAIVTQKLKIDFEVFHQVLAHYLQQGTVIETYRDFIPSQEALLLYLDTFLRIHKGKLVALLREVLLSLSNIDLFLKRKELWLETKLLEELAQSRLGDLRAWQSELQAFVTYLYPKAEPALLHLFSQKILFRLLLNQKSVAIGLFSFLELALEELAAQGLPLFVNDFQQFATQYRQEGNGSPLFIKALARIEDIEAQRERNIQLKKIIKEQTNQKPMDAPLEGRLLIHNAGMVLAGPFLYRYFDRLEMLDGLKFKDDALAQRGVQLLQFMVTGLPDMQEHELVLNKILCGVPLETPIDEHIDLTELEIEVTESLLRGLLANWDKLKSSSIDSLREGFLIRDGYLEQNAMGWQLEVDRKAMDILVDFIPWSYSLIKLSWMGMSLSTKWGRSLGE